MPKWIIDLAERAGATFAQAFLAAITVDSSGITQVDALKVGGVAGAYAVAKFLLAKANAYLSTGELTDEELGSAPPPPDPVEVKVSGEIPPEALKMMGAKPTP